LKETSISVRIFRYDPAKDGKGPYYDEYEIPYCENMDVIDVLKFIQANIDPTLTFRYSCEEGKCGLCGLLVNDEPVLACKRVVQKAEKLKIDPLPNFPIIRDLVVDRDAYNKELIELQGAFSEREACVGPVPREHLSQYLESVNCVECGACSAACPAAAAGVHINVGSVGFLQSVRSALFVRSPAITPQGGSDLFSCFECGLCHEICPRDVRIADLVRMARGATKSVGVWPAGIQQVNSVLRDSKVLLARNFEYQQNTAAWLKRAGPDITDQVEKTAKVGFFVGCQFGMRSRLRKTAIHFAELLLRARVEFTLLGDSEWCCGHPSYAAGDLEGARELARHNLEGFINMIFIRF